MRTEGEASNCLRPLSLDGPRVLTETWPGLHLLLLDPQKLGSGSRGVESRVGVLVVHLVVQTVDRHHLGPAGTGTNVSL